MRIIESPTTFEEIFKVSSAPFYIPDFKLLSSELDNFILTIESFYIDIILKQNKIVEQGVRSEILQSDTLATRTKWYNEIHNTLTVPNQKSKIASFNSSVMKNIDLLFSLSRFPIKLICCIAFGSVSSACCFLKSIAIILCFRNNYNLANNQLCNHLLDQL